MTTRRKSSVKRAELEELLKNDSNILKILMKESLHEVLDAQMTEALSAAGSERVDGRLGYRVGRYGRSLVTRIEKLERRMPRDRAGHISTESLERYQVIAEHAGFRFRNLELGSCPPLLRDVTRFVEPRRAVDCAHGSDIVGAGIGDYPVVIMSGLWNGYMARSADFLPALYATIDELARSHRLVVVLGKAPTLSGYDRKCREKALKMPLLECPSVMAPDMAEIAALNQQLRSFAATRDQVRYFDANEFLCPQGQCGLNDADGAPRYFDFLHLSLQGARDLGRVILRQAGPPAFAGIADETAVGER